MKEEIFIDAQLCAIILPAGYDESGIRFFTLNAASVNIHVPRARCVLGARMCLSLTQIKVWANAAAMEIPGVYPFPDFPAAGGLLPGRTRTEVPAGGGDRMKR